MIKTIWFELVARLCYVVLGLIISIVGLISPKRAENGLLQIGKDLRKLHANSN